MIGREVLLVTVTWRVVCVKINKVSDCGSLLVNTAAAWIHTSLVNISFIPLV